MKRVRVFGAGAVGGCLAARLAALAPLASARAAGAAAPTLETVAALLAARARALGLHAG